MCHHEMADSLIQARTRRNIGGGAEGRHLQGSKLEGESCRFPPHAPAHYLPHRRPPIPIRIRPSRHALASLRTLCMLPCTVAGSGSAGAPGYAFGKDRRLCGLHRLDTVIQPQACRKPRPHSKTGIRRPRLSRRCAWVSPVWTDRPGARDSTPRRRTRP